jgi:methyltransferase-like protein/cyclopropane fatty-acyl-phospholipid synthase-like methyltransferase
MLEVASSYDDVPYDNLTFPQTHPDRLATMARIFGLASPRVATSRVLELGCASGANLIPMAFNLPGATFVGIDLSRSQVEKARETIEALHLQNISVKHASIAEVDDGWGEFDYIICHGVFSWVERPIQDKILHIAFANLAPAGVAYVSYNVYPGWHMREMVRHMMRYHAGRFEGPAEQIEQARALLDFLVSAADHSGAYGQLLNQEVERLNKASDSYLYHEHLEQTNAPIYFHQFIERAEDAGLQYLSEADASDMLAARLPKPVAETLEQISPDILHLEQYMDFVRNRLFRQTLLCHRHATLRRALTPDVLDGLLLSCPAVLDQSPPDLAEGVSMVFASGHQRADSSRPATKAALAVLAERWPEAVSVGDLSRLALERAAPFVPASRLEDTRRSMMTDLLTSVMYGLIHVHTEAPRCTCTPSDTPLANRLAAFQAHRSDIVVNAHHEMFRLDPVAIESLKLADGRRDRAAILEVLIELAQQGRLLLQRGDEAIKAPEQVRAILSDQLDTVLTKLARLAILVE